MYHQVFTHLTCEDATIFFSVESTQLKTRSMWIKTWVTMIDMWSYNYARRLGLYSYSATDDCVNIE